MTEPVLLDPAAVAERIGVTRATIHQYRYRDTIREPGARRVMPEPDVSTSPNVCLWFESTIDEWIATRS